jgi:transposase-like protein
VERKKGERYSEEFRREAVQQMKSCDNILRRSRELGIHRRLLYNWRERLDESNPAPLRSREFILPKEITKLKRKVGARRRRSIASGAKTFLT